MEKKIVEVRFSRHRIQLDVLNVNKISNFNRKEDCSTRQYVGHVDITYWMRNCLEQLISY